MNAKNTFSVKCVCLIKHIEQCIQDEKAENYSAA